MFPLSLACFLSLSLQISAATAKTVGSEAYAEIEDGKFIHQADDRYLSIALDCSLIGYKWKTFNATNPKVIALAKGLSPAILRLGGTACDYMIFNSTFNVKFHDKKYLTSFRDYGAILRIDDWDRLVSLSKEANFTLLYDANAMTRNIKDIWDPTNFKSFLNYNKLKKNSNLIFELGNEPNNWPVHFHSISGTRLAHDFSIMKEVVQNDSYYKNHWIVGADIGNPYIHSIGLDPAIYIKEFFSAGHSYINALTWHQYYLKGSTAQVQDFINSTVMDIFQEQVDIVSSIVKETLGGKSFPVWMGETSSAYDSGAAHISNSYVAGFLWLDKLGVAAKSKYDIVIRQTFYDGWYSLIDHELNPLPDYWLSLLYKQLVGSRALELNLTAGQGQIRAYAHCTRNGPDYPPGSVTIYAMNLSKEKATLHTNIRVDAVYTYLLEPSDGNLTSTYVNLNGKKLTLQNDQLPSLKPVKMDAIHLNPLTFGLFVLSDVKAAGCM